MPADRLLVRLDQETRRFLQQLAERQGTSMSDAARFAIREVALRRGLSGDERDLFTERARKALQAASDLATLLHSAAIEPEHLLAGLLDVPEGCAILILRALGVDVESLRAAAEGALPPGGERPGGMRGLDAESKLVVERAVQEANRLGHHYVGTEHLLLDLIGERSPGVVQALAAASVRSDSVLAAVELRKERLAASGRATRRGPDARGRGTGRPVSSPDQSGAAVRGRPATWRERDGGHEAARRAGPRRQHLVRVGRDAAGYRPTRCALPGGLQPGRPRFARCRPHPA